VAVVQQVLDRLDEPPDLRWIVKEYANTAASEIPACFRIFSWRERDLILRFAKNNIPNPTFPLERRNTKS
jgi:hypothetical protein